MTEPETSLEDVSRETSGLDLDPEQLVLLRDYHDFLASAGVERGLIGPREGDKLWSRHILNCAVVVSGKSNLVPEGSSVADIGSGAGLPGIVWSIVRPDLKMILVEPLLRRTRFLVEVVDELGLSARVEIKRARAEELPGELSVNVTTARAVAPLERLLPILAPLTQPGGMTLALKGAKADGELAANRALAKSLGYGDTEVLSCGEGIVNPPTKVIRLRRTRA